MDSDSTISRVALGNIALLGALYDAKHDIFTGLSIFKKSIPDEALTITDDQYTDSHFIHSDDFSEKFQKLDVKAELQVSVLAGLSKPHGSGNYLKDQKKSAKTVKCSLLYNIKTKDESVNMYHEKLKEAYSIDAIECGIATHVVVGISWGANSILSCEYENIENADIQKIEGCLSAELKKLLACISGKLEAEYKEGEILKSLNFKMRMYGDVLPNNGELPTDFQSALQLMKQIPQLVSGCNNGKGRPLTYKLLPIILLQKYLNFAFKCDGMLKSLEESSLLRVVMLFEELSRAQQKVHDFYDDALKHRYCVLDDDFKKISIVKGELTIEESKLRSKLATVLVKGRSGEAEASTLEDLIKEFQASECSPHKVDAALVSWGHLTKELNNKKINWARNMVDNGAKYIGHGIDMDNELLKDFELKIFLFYFNCMSSADAHVWNRNRHLFFHELKKRSEGCKAYVVDCDIHPTLLPQGKTSCIQVVHNGEILSNDLRLEQEKQQRLPWAQATAKAKKIVHRPNKRVPLSIPCTGENCVGDVKYDWICKTCESVLEVGIDGHVYCKCGMIPATLLEFKCPHSRHGIAFGKHEAEYYDELLKNLEESSFKELNILILGEIGVGKSTWINAFANLMKYSSLQEVVTSDTVTLIPSKFTVLNEDFEKVVVETGNDSNEILVDGQTTTQQAKIHTIEIKGATFRLIDTPGIGDVHGIDQDKLNVLNIIDTISHLDELHGICIFMKANNSRVPVMLQYCVTELLSIFHRDASKNIMFCFTNSHDTFYKPGDTMPILKELLLEKPGSDVGISQQTVYCFDSETYRFLAAVKNDPPTKFADDEKHYISLRWEKSIKETMRMLKHIESLKPYSINTTINLNHIRSTILTLTKQLIEIPMNIQTCKTSVQCEKDIYKKLEEEENQKLDFQTCGMFRPLFIMEEIESIKEAKKVKKKIIESKENLIKEYEKELKELQNSSIICACFSKTDVITPNNDKTEKYLNHLIQEEKAKVAAGRNKKVYDRLMQSRESYIKEGQAIEKAMAIGKMYRCGERNALTPDEIKSRVQHLKGLKHTGPAFQAALHSSRKSGP